MGAAAFALLTVLLSAGQFLCFVKCQGPNIGNGLYIITSAVKGADNAEYALHVEGRATSKNLHDVMLQTSSQPTGQFFWDLRNKNAWLSTLIPPTNPQNIVSQNEHGVPYQFQFPPIGAYMFRIERFVGNSMECLKSNGVGKSVSFVSCGRPDRDDQSLLWEFKVVARSTLL